MLMNIQNTYKIQSRLELVLCDLLLCDGINNRLGIPVGVEIVGQRSADSTALEIPLLEEESEKVALASSLSQLFPGYPGDLQFLARLGLIVKDDLVEGLNVYE